MRSVAGRSACSTMQVELRWNWRPSTCRRTAPEVHCSPPPRTVIKSSHRDGCPCLHPGQFERETGSLGHACSLQGDDRGLFSLAKKRLTTSSGALAGSAAPSPKAEPQTVDRRPRAAVHFGGPMLLCDLLNLPFAAGARSWRHQTIPNRVTRAYPRDHRGFGRWSQAMTCGMLR